MSSTAYHHGQLREALIDAAVDVVREKGADELALRELARRVGVSHNAAYRHFDGRDALMTEVAGRAMELLMATMQRRLASVDVEDPVLHARLRMFELGRAYVEFAVREPGLFRLAFSTLSAADGPDTYLILGELLDDLVDVGYIDLDARPGAEVTCWSAVHGFATLAIDGALDDETDAERDESLTGVLLAIDRSYGAATGAVGGSVT